MTKIRLGDPSDFIEASHHCECLGEGRGETRRIVAQVQNLITLTMALLDLG